MGAFPAHLWTDPEQPDNVRRICGRGRGPGQGAAYSSQHADARTHEGSCRLGQVGFHADRRNGRRWKNVPLPRAVGINGRRPARVGRKGKHQGAPPGRWPFGCIHQRPQRFNGEESDAPLARLEKSVLGGDDTEIVILAANHGQVLDRLRDLGRRQGRHHPLRKPLQEFFLQAGQEPERLAVFDLSRSVGRMALEEVVAAVAKHVEWDNCARCSLKSDGKVCPIYENRERLLGRGDAAQLGPAWAIWWRSPGSTGSICRSATCSRYAPT